MPKTFLIIDGTTDVNQRFHFVTATSQKEAIAAFADANHDDTFDWEECEDGDLVEIFEAPAEGQFEFFPDTQ